MDPALLAAYLATCMLLVLAPGPDSLLVLSRSLQGGRGAGLRTALGALSGNTIHTTLAALGVSAAISALPMALQAVRILGAAYLAWLGILALRASARAGSAMSASVPHSGRMWRHALATNLLNPKIILFFVAFIPQFITPRAGRVGAQIFALGMILALMGFAWHMVLATCAARAARLLARPRVAAAFEAVVGIVFLGFAARLLVD
jgi:threonine/homoserine/homoserine lactone efflux protein